MPRQVRGLLRTMAGLAGEALLVTPKISISCPTTYTATIFEDIENDSVAGAAGIGLSEHKFEGHEDGPSRTPMDAVVLQATLCCPAILSLIPDPFGNNHPDSIWSRPAAEVAGDSVEKFLRVWNTMYDAG